MISTLFHLQILASLLLFWTRHVQTHSSPSYKLTDKLSPRLLDSSDSVNASEPALSHSSDGFDLRKRQACITLGCGIGSECYDVCGCVSLSPPVSCTTLHQQNTHECYSVPSPINATPSSPGQMPEDRAATSYPPASSSPQNRTRRPY